MRPTRVLIKLGGAALQSERSLIKAADLILQYRAKGTQVVLVHGGGPAINEELRRRGIEWTFINGQRVTTKAMMDAIESTLWDRVNKRLVLDLEARGLPVIGVSGAEHEILLCTQASAELGQVGKIRSVNAEWLNDAINRPSMPLLVVAPLGVDRSGQRYNINADWAATHVAAALCVDELVFLTDMDGVLDEEGAKIPAVNVSGLRNMIEARTVTGGMMAKCLAVIFALEHGVGRVRILKGDDADRVNAQENLGTHCVLTRNEFRETAHVTV